MTNKEALDTLMSSADYNFYENGGNKIVYDGNVEAYEFLKTQLDRLELLEKKCQNGKYILTIQGNMNMAKSAIEIVIEKYGAENVIIKHLPTLGIVDIDYFKTKLEKIGE